MAVAMAAAVFLCGFSAASAMDNKMSKSSAGSAMASDTLSLTASQRKTAWNDLNKGASEQTAPKGFTAKVGAVFPSSLKTEPVPTNLASDVPALRPYDFAMLQKKIVIVNPTDKKIAEVITH